MRSIFQYALPAFAVRRSTFATAALLLVGCAGGSMQTGSQTPVATNDAMAPVDTKSVVALNVALPAVTRLLHPGVYPRARTGSVNPDVTGPFITTLQAYGSDANVYQVTTTPPARPRKRAPGPYLTFLSSFRTGLNMPYGTSITPSGAWYVANAEDANVLVFKIGSSGVVSGPVKTLSDPGGPPVDVDANASGSLVAASNNTSDGTSPDHAVVELYAKGSTVPTGKLGVAGAAYGVGVAIDKGGNCYWSYDTSPSGPGEIAEFTKCRGSAQPVTSVGVAAGLAFNKANDLFYVDQAAGTVNRCVGNTSCHVLASGFEDPWGMNFDAGWKHLWVTELGTATIYALNPNTGAILSSTPAEGGGSDPPFGIAAAPGPKY